MTNRAELAEKKLTVLNALIKNPEIGDYALSRLIKSDYRTARKYREEMVVRLATLKGDVEARMEAKIREDASIWNRIISLIRTK